MKGCISFCLIGLLALPATGCFPDKQEAYRAVVDKHGELVPADPLARTFEKAPDPHSTVLVLAKKKEEKEKAEEEKQAQERLPDAFFGIPAYPNAHFSEGQRGIIVSGTMKQVFLETPDIPAFVDSYYVNKLPIGSRTEAAGVKGKIILYTFPVLGQEIRTLAIQNLERSTQIVLTSMEDPTRQTFTNSAPPRLNTPQPSSRVAPNPKPLPPGTKLPAMPATPTRP